MAKQVRTTGKPVAQTVDQKALTLKQKPRSECFSVKTEEDLEITVALDKQTDKSGLPLVFPTDAVGILLDAPTKEYPLKNGKTTYYVCQSHSCLPPTNDLNELFENAHS